MKKSKFFIRFISQNLSGITKGLSLFLLKNIIKILKTMELPFL